MNKPLKAYEAHDGDEGWAIVFARYGAEARRFAASEMDTEWEGVDWCRRRPHLDTYAPGPVPVEAMIEMGWRFECHTHCCPSRSGYGYWIDAHCETRVCIGSTVYCSPWCRLLDAEDRAIGDRYRREERERLIAKIIGRYDGAAIVPDTQGPGSRNSGLGKYRAQEASVDFTWPGGQYPATLSYASETSCFRHGRKPDADGDELRIAYLDQQAWADYRAQAEAGAS